MANVTFSGPVRSQGGFQVVSIDATTGTVTVGSTYGDDVSVTNVTAAGTVNTSDLIADGTVILTGLPTSDPNVAGAIWSNSGVITLSAAV